MEKPRPLLPQHSRYDFVPLPERKDYSWPGGKRLAFCLTTNVEWFAFGAGLGHDPAKTGEPQTHRNYSWRDYGNRVGVWRLLELFDELKLPAAHNTNSLVYEYAPQVMAAIRKRGDEVVAHGRTNAENLRGLWQPDEERILREVTDTIARHEGAPPAGWMGSGAYETANTPDLLKELGYQYLMDWPMDDQPVWLRTRAGPLLSIPYPIELNDSQAIVHRKGEAAEFCDMIVDQFEEMAEQCERHPLVMNVSVHTYIFGQPYRLRRLRAALRHCMQHAHAGRVWWTRPREVARFCHSLPPGVIPGSSA
jgi:allantoinase